MALAARTRSASACDAWRCVRAACVKAPALDALASAGYRAVAIDMAFGPEPALQLVESLSSEPALRDYHLLSAVRGDLLAKLGRDDEARAEFGRAAGLTQNARQRAMFEDRAAGCST